jgi:hypothetical protein
MRTVRITSLRTTSGNKYKGIRSSSAFTSGP